jgi:hypothetical protein
MSRFDETAESISRRSGRQTLFLEDGFSLKSNRHAINRINKKPEAALSERRKTMLAAH